MRSLVTLVLAASCAGTAPAPITPPAPTALARLEASRDLDGKFVGTTDAPATIVVMLASWCEHCRAELPVLQATASAHHVRVFAVNYRGHEEYDHRGNSAAMRTFAARAPWLRIVPIDDDVFSELGSPPLIPMIFVYDHAGALVTTFDRRSHEPPTGDEIAAVLAKLGA
jgi:thiol-disulfide isomerase/thioredoxin